ncbi:MAG: alpha/beta hydrolase [Actinomycetia bacterium]|nr:alpha/beta hydrolase [Actinomycetes bacterium]
MDLNINGLTIHASTGGRPFDPEKPTVILLHGAGMDHTVWQFQARAFAYRGYSVLSLDLPGHGRSDDPAPETISGYANVVAELIDAVCADSAHIVGHSMGAFIGIELAARYPDKVRSLTLIGVSERMPVHPDLLAAAEVDDHLAFDLVSSWGHTRTAHTGGHPTPGLWMMGSTIRLLERSKPGVLHNDLAACNAYDTALARAAEISAPTLVLIGEHDLMTRPKGAAFLAEAIPDSATVIVRGAGHSLMVERPDAVIDELLALWTSA